MTVSSRTPRPIDHLVLPVSDLGVARDRLTALGFTVAKDARHPFGTENCCVFLSDGSYLEPLGIANREECEASYGKEKCAERSDGNNHSFFGPLMTGFFLSQMMRNGVAANGFNSAPAFRDNNGGWQRPART